MLTFSVQSESSGGGQCRWTFGEFDIPRKSCSPFLLPHSRRALIWWMLCFESRGSRHCRHFCRAAHVAAVIKSCTLSRASWMYWCETHCHTASGCSSEVSVCHLLFLKSFWLWPTTSNPSNFIWSIYCGIACVGPGKDTFHFQTLRIAGRDLSLQPHLKFFFQDFFSFH